jgi:hypothetical protein
MVKKLKNWFNGIFSKKATIGSWLMAGLQFGVLLVGAAVIAKWTKVQLFGSNAKLPKLQIMTVLKNRKAA